ncbi:MAG: 30S ribosomal protein S8e [Nanoarchaeota archaeon]|nr:30S ribosomal protein S8e [Nanoarchaeota archaeon]
MTKWNLKSKKKPTGGRMKKIRKKKRRDRGMSFVDTKISKKILRPKRGRGGTEKLKLLGVEKANILDPKTKKHQTVKILSVEDNKANVHYVRRNIITKGAIIKTEAGLARVTSRPGQHGMINAVLIDEKK